MNPYYTGVILSFISANGFGLIPIFAIYAYDGGATVETLLFFRFVLAALFFFLYTFISKQELKVNKVTLLYLVLMGCVLYTLQSACYFSSVRYIPASLAVLLFYTYPVLVAVLAVIVEKEKLTEVTVASIVISFLGLALVLGTSFGNVNLHGMMLACAAALVYSCYITIGSRVLKELPVLVTSAYVTMFASFSFLATGLVTGNLDFNLEKQAWLAIAGVALFCTIIAIFTFFKGIELIGSTNASIISMVEPLTTIGFSAVLFGERLGAMQIAGGLAVLMGSLLVAMRKNETVNPEDV